MQRNHQELSCPLDTAREAAKHFIRPYALSDLWTYKELSRESQWARHPEYTAILGNARDPDGKQYHLERGNVAVIRFGGRECWNVFDLSEIMAEIRNEARGDQQPQSLAAIFEEQERVAQAQREEEEELQRTEQPTPRKQPAIFRSYQGGNCRQCGAELGYIEADGGRDREFCDNKGKCRQAHHRAKKRETNRAATLQYHAEMREYWHLYGIHGEVLLRLQEILLQHGKAAARAATDAVLVALAANEQAGTTEQSRLIEEILLGGELIGFEEVKLDNFRIPAGWDGWTEFVSQASTNYLRQMRGYLYEREQRRAQVAAGRKRLEQLSGQETPQPRSTGPA